MCFRAFVPDRGAAPAGNLSWKRAIFR